ncbi:MAG: sigma-54 dependent transcriptional regulator [Thermodesulfobacteriota bacterium]
MYKPTILIVDDDYYTLELLKKVLEKRELNLFFAKDGEEALNLFKKEPVDIILLDQKMPGISGLNVLKSIKSLDPNVVVVIMTGYGTIGEAVEAMKLGAFHYMTKPFNDLDEIDVVVNKALRERALLDEVSYLRKKVTEAFSYKGMIGKSEVMKKILDFVEKIAPTDSNVILQGESGTGKELLARIIHQMSSRANGKFITVSCGAIPVTLHESILFGFQKGAFTGAIKTTKGYFEEAEGGTLFLDEITETSLDFQTSFLRIIEEREFSRVGDTATIKANFRLISTTNRDLKKEVSEGTFREDLYYRINVVPITIHPLRDRREDISLLANHFLNEFNKKMSRRVGPFTYESISALEGAEWMGNVRELRNIVESIVSIKDKGEITLADLPEYLIKPEGTRGEVDAFFLKPYRKAKETFEIRYLKELLARTEGNIAKAAKESGIKRQNIYDKLKKFGIGIK